VNDGKPGAAVGAIDERIIQPVFLSGQVGQTIPANGDIRTYHRDLVRQTGTGLNDKILKNHSLNRFGIDGMNMGCQWFPALQVIEECPDMAPMPLHQNVYAIVPVFNRSFQMVLYGHPENKGPETNPLYHSPDMYLQRLQHTPDGLFLPDCMCLNLNNFIVFKDMFSRGSNQPYTPTFQCVWKSCKKDW